MSRISNFGQMSDFSMSGLGYEDILKYGLIRAIDTEAGNPPMPVPYAPSPASEKIYLSTPTGTGSVTKEVGTLSKMDNLTPAHYILGLGFLVAGLVLYKVM